jgi:hypothetical protein
MSVEDFSLRPDALILKQDTLPTGTRYYIPEGRTDGGRDGLIVTFGLGEAGEWTGVFAFGNNGQLRTRAIVPLPESDLVVVVSDGDGYMVHERQPGSFDGVRAVPVRSVHVIPSAGLLVLADDTTMCAYGRQGLVWETERIAWSELVIEDVSSTKIRCRTYDIRSEENLVFEVDVQDGRCHGGIEVI